MKKITKNLLNFMSTRLGFVLSLLTIYWLKTMWAYTVDFNLDIQGAYQIFLALINPCSLSGWSQTPSTTVSLPTL